MPKADPLFSAGARLERAAFREHLRTRITAWSVCGSKGTEADVLTAVLKWVQGRQKRYDKRPGGLGK